MRNPFLSIFVISVIILIVAGCAVKVQPILNSSLGIDAFENMKKIDPQNISLALYIGPKLRHLKVNQKLKMGEYTFQVGDAFSVKLIKALSYKFRTIILIDTPNYSGDVPVDALMRVSLQDVDVNMDVKSGFYVATTEGYTRLSIRAEIRDIKEGKTVWVGTTQAKETNMHEELGQMTYQEAGRGFATSIDKAIDIAIGSLINQMGKSSNLKLYIDKWKNT